MSERVEARNHGTGKQPLLASCGPLAGQPPAGREAGTIYADPRQVVEDPLLTIPEKREVLASWASDSRAPHDSPSMRMLDSGAVVHVREILEALKSLDERARPTRNDGQCWPRPHTPAVAAEPGTLGVIGAHGEGSPRTTMILRLARCGRVPLAPPSRHSQPLPRHRDMS